MIRRRQAYPHWHPEAFDGPCQHDDPWATPGLQWPVWLRVTFLAAGLIVTGYILLALIGALGEWFR